MRVLFDSALVPFPSDMTCFLFLGVAFTSKMLDPRPTANGDWSFQKVFGDADFIAAGVLVIPPKGRKPSKGTKDNTYVSSSSDKYLMKLMLGADLLRRGRRSKSKNPRDKPNSSHGRDVPRSTR